MAVQMKQCCIEYLAELDRCEVIWREELAGPNSYMTQEIFDEIVADNLRLRTEIAAGTYVAFEKNVSCPWDEEVFNGPIAESYKWFTRYFAAGGKMEDLEIGPIEVIRDA